MKKYYAGIGSRNTPRLIQDLMTESASKLDDQGYVLRSGGAKGADQAFEKGASSKEIFTYSDAESWAFQEVQKHLPIDRSGFNGWKDVVKGLLARNMMQVLGKESNEHVAFILCWTPSTYYEDSSAGGTAYAIRCALHYQIPIINLAEENNLLTLQKYLDLEDSFEHIFKLD